MRIKITLDNPAPTAIPVNYQHHLTAVVYRLLESSSTDYAQFLHDTGYAPLATDSHRFKLFVFSWLQTRNRRIEGDVLWLGAGEVTWWIASPVEPFLVHCATGLLNAGTIAVAASRFAVTQVETVTDPDFAEGTFEFTCLSPLVASLDAGNGTADYIRPTDGEIFSNAVRNNLIRKYHTLTGQPPLDNRFTMEFDQPYLERTHGGTKKITFKSIDIIGAMAPFVAAGSPELLDVAYNCGVGEKNGAGFGMVEAKARRDGKAEPGASTSVPDGNGCRHAH